MDDDDDVSKMAEKLIKDVTEMQSHLQRIVMPNLRATEK